MYPFYEGLQTHDLRLKAILFLVAKQTRNLIQRNPFPNKFTSNATDI